MKEGIGMLTFRNPKITGLTTFLSTDETGLISLIQITYKDGDAFLFKSDSEKIGKIMKKAKKGEKIDGFVDLMIKIGKLKPCRGVKLGVYTVATWGK